jgi:RimJ/RimL family protein N-acetyltransferase
MLKLQNEPENREFLGREMPISRKAEEAWLAARTDDRDNIVFVIAIKEPCTKPIGSMGLHHIDRKNRRATTGAAILKEYCGQGFGSDAKMLLLSYAFLQLGLQKVESRVLATNPRSIAYSKKCGYEEVGLLKKHHFRGGQWVDEVVLELHAEEWLPRWEAFTAKKDPAVLCTQQGGWATD